MKRQVMFASTVLAGLALSGVALAQSGQGPSPSSAPAKETTQVEEVIVTGVFSATSIENAPISISAVTAQQIEQQTPVSAADLLKSVPGVFVNSALGEIRNVVFSRGVSANSLDGAGGYFYVSLQEDGLPTEVVTANNFGPDYFARADLMLDHLEALRGGTAVITGPNAPGGIFNYISKTGKSDPGTSFQMRYGLEGDGENPLYRGDFYTGGRFGDSNLYYALGGFYRQSDGARSPGYPVNKGGQIRGNLLWDYDKGFLELTGKYLDDRNGWFEFIPAFNYKDPSLAPGFNNQSSVWPPKSGAHCYTNPDMKRGCWDPSNLVHSKGIALGANWSHDISDTLRIDNKMRYTSNKANWNTTAVAFPVPITEFIISIIDGTLGLPGQFTYRDQKTGVLLAQVNSVTGFDRTVTLSNLPGANVLANGVISQGALASLYKAQAFTDQLTLTKTWGDHHLALGGYVSIGSLSDYQGSGGIGFSTLQPSPRMIAVTLLNNGVTYQVTDPGGFTGENRGGVGDNSYDGDQRQFSLFLSDNWQVNDKLSIDAGVRYENLKYDITSVQANGFQGNLLTTPGVDGNPLTLWDNGMTTLTAPTRVVRKYEFLAYTGSVAYQFTDNFQSYIRYTRGKKAPDFGIIQGINTPSEAATIYPDPQVITQVELGLKYHAGRVRLQAFPFYSKLSNVANGQVFTYLSGPQVGQFYSPPPVFGQIETYGVEFSGDVDVTDKLNLIASVTLQQPKASGFTSYAQGPRGDGTDDIQTVTPSGDADNNPKVIVRGTATYNPTSNVSFFATYNYLGERAANRLEAFHLPAFSTVDAGASWKVTDHVKLQANVSNVFNSLGIMSWARGGGFLAALDRQSLRPIDVRSDPNALFSVVPSQPRAFYLTATFDF